MSSTTSAIFQIETESETITPTPDLAFRSLALTLELYGPLRNAHGVDFLPLTWTFGWRWYR
jgi:hypothetical protein